VVLLSAFIFFCTVIVLAVPASVPTPSDGVKVSSGTQSGMREVGKTTKVPGNMGLPIVPGYPMPTPNSTPCPGGQQRCLDGLSCVTTTCGGGLYADLATCACTSLCTAPTPTFCNGGCYNSTCTGPNYWDVGSCSCVPIPTTTTTITTTTTTGGPTTTVGGPTTTVGGPTTTVGGPTTTDSGPTTTDGGPTTTDEGPTTTDEGPTTTDEGPTTTEEGPTTTEEGPTTTESGPTTTEEAPTTTIRESCDSGLEMDCSAQSNFPMVCGLNVRCECVCRNVNQ